MDSQCDTIHMSTLMTNKSASLLAQTWSDTFKHDLQQLLTWRRDVRHFKTDPVASTLIDACLNIANLSPSVGLSQPWRFVLVESPSLRDAVENNFKTCFENSLNGYEGEKRQKYASLKLAGLKEAPVHLAVLCAENTPDGHGLGRATMPEMLRYSVVCAVHTLWLYARSQGLGVGWVSILDPEQILNIISAPEGCTLVAYLCMGWPQDHQTTPELERTGWEKRENVSQKVWRV